jgi:putative membrane-bound dehydrogenase-like protein
MNLRIPARVLLASLGSALLAQQGSPDRVDFDQDGTPESLLHQPGKSTLQRSDGSNADFQFPEGIHALDAQGRDNGLRFVDLNGDGFVDLLQANPSGYAIHLWNRNVQPLLGWTKGWSQFVRAGQRTGAPDEPPSLVGLQVSVVDGQVVLSHNGTTQRLNARELIAVRMPPPKSPEEALASMRLRDGFEIGLVAAEPIVIDPVYLDWDTQGRMWVVEMRDYPLGIDGKGKPGGQVKVLHDDDGDGRMDRAVPFLTDIPFPSSVLPYGKGALVAAAPDLFYAEDTDGDGRADVRKVLFTGFNPGNQQHRFNGFEWGLDGWLYLANGDSGGTVKSVATGKSMSISGRDLRLRPDTGEMETVSAQTQFGRRRDDWGNWFGNNNPTWLWHVTLPEHYLRRNPAVAVKRVSRTLANDEDSTRTFPASAPMTRPNQPWSLNHVTSGCSPTPYRDDLFGPDFATSVFASEPVHNVIHREVLSPDGSGLQSHRAPDERKSEFLASTDHWFRPTTLKTGPDGALYVTDMYRFILEHPEWISAEMQARVNLRAGEDRGRIYRIAPKGSARRPIPNLARLDTAGLVAAMESPNGWQRDLVMNLLATRRDTAAIEPLRALLQPSRRPQVRVQALATLGLLGALDLPSLSAALSDPHPAVRRQALEQSERLAPAPRELFDSVAALASDPDPAVRLQAAFSLGPSPAEWSEPVLRDLATRDASDESIRIAVQTSLTPDSALFRELKAGQAPARAATPPNHKPSSTDRAQVITRFTTTAALKGNPGKGHAHFTALCAGCHRLRGEGNEVGPDLNMVATKPVDWMLHAILDPSQAIEARYRAWSLQVDGGEPLSGIIAAETANNLVLRYAGNPEVPVLRSQIRSMTPMKESLMPAGFESALQPQDMADLLTWIRGE